MLEGPQPGPPAWNPLASAFADTTYIMFVITVLVLDALNFTGTDIALYQVTRESFGHPSNDGNRYVFFASPVTSTL